MNYLVTGAAGFIASRLCEFLLAAGHRVTGIDNLNDYYDPRLKLYRLGRLAATAGAPGAARLLGRATGVAKPVSFSPAPPAIRSSRFTFRTLDIENLPALDRLFARGKFDAVFNLAARAGVRYSLENPRIYLTTNALGTLNVLECQRRHGVKKQVLASTSSLYAGCPLPFTEDQPVNAPLSPYAATKKAAELLTYTYHRLYGLDVSVLRYFTVFGPAGRPDMSPFRFIKWIDEGRPLELFGDGTQARDFTYVDDIARGTVLAAEPLGYEIINLGGGRNPLSLRTIIALIERLVGKKARIQGRPFHAADLKETWADITKAGRLLRWKPEVTPEEGFRRTVEWHVANRGWLRRVRV
ncbi:MAG: nucleotide sugar epimerase [Verrucomicrobia bacterium RIFCSPLOWO2_12_FULL_64_8]|nr:MAG: nucleotide sugar epimerase [Verrucomicrobia bacterium RIFCSPLOWO2_12_FULL_64_8]